MTAAVGWSDLRVGAPAAVVWAASAVLVGSVTAAWGVSVVAAVVAVAGVVVLARSRADGLRMVASIAVATALFVGLVGVSVAVGAAERAPAALASPPRGPVAVQVVLGRDLAPGDRSVVGTLVAVDAVASPLHVPVRVVPDRDHDHDHQRTLGAGSQLSARAVVQPDTPGAATAFVLFIRGSVTVGTPSGLLAVTDDTRRAFVDVTRGLPEPGAALLRGLAIGDRSGLDADTEAAMETSALTHLTAVSGDIVSHRDGFDSRTQLSNVICT